MRLEGIFMPYSRKQRDELLANQKRFVHYTSAEAALNILKEKRLWMRNTTCMSDYREVNHGYELFSSFFSNPENNISFIKALDLCAPGVAVEAVKNIRPVGDGHSIWNVYRVNF